MPRATELPAEAAMQAAVQGADLKQDAVKEASSQQSSPAGPKQAEAAAASLEQRVEALEKQATLHNLCILDLCKLIKSNKDTPLV
jgi:hypothetical protein